MMGVSTSGCLLLPSTSLVAMHKSNKKKRNMLATRKRSPFLQQWTLQQWIPKPLGVSLVRDSGKQANNHSAA